MADIGGMVGLGNAAEAQTFGKLGNIFQAIYGLRQLHKGNKDLANLDATRPQRTTDSNLLYNQKLAQNIASTGIPDSAKNYYTESVNRALGGGIKAILQGGGDINMISSLVGGATDSYKQMLAADAQQKLLNQGVLMQQNQNVANENATNWNWNTADPYLTKYARATQMTNSGAQNSMAAIRGAGGQAAADNFASPTYGGASGYGNVGGASIYGNVGGASIYDYNSMG